jgi:hypothetical protein
MGDLILTGKDGQEDYKGYTPDLTAPMLDPKIEQFIERYATGQYTTKTKLAEEIGVSRQAVTEWTQKYAIEINDRITSIRERNRQRVSQVVNEAIDVLQNQLSSPDGKLAQGAAVAIARHGLPTQSDVDIRQTAVSVVISPVVDTKRAGGV